MSSAMPPFRNPWSDPRTIAPTAEAWASMSPNERDRAELHVLEALDEYREFMAEGTRHSRSKINAFTDLDDHFSHADPSALLATDLAVLYPGQPVIVPDLLAVMDIEDPARERNSWRVIDEGRGIDLVLEFRNMGKKHKDLVENVTEYAALGIAEYFSLDCVTLMLRGWRLSSPSARQYTQMMPQGGVFRSAVLDLELGVSGGRLRFFKNLAEIPTSEELLGRVQRMADGFQDRAAEAERQAKDAERQAKDAERQAQEAIARIVNVCSGMAELLLRQIDERGWPVTEAHRARVTTCEDPNKLLRWLGGASSARSVDELLAD